MDTADQWEISGSSLKAKITGSGAELKSLTDRTGHEYLYQGNDGTWNKSSPVLFPIIGGLPSGSYTVDGKEYSMKSHGFALRSQFSLVTADSSMVSLKLTDSTETLAQYPFPFELTVSHHIEGPSLLISYEVHNTGTSVMPFSIGAHPAFQCPMERGHTFDEYRLRFNKRETVKRRIKQASLLNGETAACLEDSDELRLSHSLFDIGPIILDGLKSNSVCLGLPDEGPSIEMDFSGFTHFGIWQMEHKQPQFICLEPWYGVDSTLDGPTDFREKEGMIHLSPGKRFSSKYRITIHTNE